jgi:hypothetical protein
MGGCRLRLATGEGEAAEHECDADELTEVDE